MSNRSSQRIDRSRSGEITAPIELLARIVGAVTHMERLTRRTVLVSATIASITTVPQIRYLAFKSLRGGLRWLRKTCFTRSRPLEAAVLIPQSRDAVTDLLERNGFEPGWALSYNYRDEILNLRRIERHTHPSGVDWWQVHVRGYDHPDRIELTAHFEPEPRRHPRAHFTLSGLDIDHGMGVLLKLLEHQQIGYNWLNAPAKRKQYSAPP